MSLMEDKQQKELLRVENLKMHFPIRRGLLRKTIGHVKAVDGVSFTVRRGEIVGLVGESGCGKSTTGRCLVRLLDPTSGEILFQDQDGETIHVEQLRSGEMRRIRPKMQMMFQDPYSSLKSPSDFSSRLSANR